MEVTLDDDQSDEVVEIMDKIDTIGKKTLEEIFMEAESSGVSGSVRGDNRQNMKDVKTDQERNSNVFLHHDILIKINSDHILTLILQHIL